MLEPLGKDGIKSFCIQINIATAVMVEIYKRLCWICITVNTHVHDHVGNTDHLSDITELSEGRILYPEQFANKPDYEQKSLLQDLRLKDVLYTRTNWIKQGEESLQQIVSIFREESLLQIVPGIYDPNAILKNLSEQGICFDSKDLIDSERNAVDQDDQREGGCEDDDLLLP